MKKIKNDIRIMSRLKLFIVTYSMNFIQDNLCRKDEETVQDLRLKLVKMLRITESRIRSDLCYLYKKEVV